MRSLQRRICRKRKRQRDDEHPQSAEQQQPRPIAAEQDRSLWASWITLKHADDPRALLDALLSGIAKRIGRPAYRGCPFLNLMTEFPDQNHPGRVVARGNKEEMRARLATIVAKLGAAS